jgi:hypothetical protein
MHGKECKTTPDHCIVAQRMGHLLQTCVYLLDPARLLRAVRQHPHEMLNIVEYGRR